MSFTLPQSHRFRDSRFGDAPTSTPGVRHAAEYGTSEHAGWAAVERGLCLLVLFLLGWRMVFHAGLTYGNIAALALTPLWAGVIHRYRHGTLLFVGAVVCFLSGSTLAVLTGSTGRTWHRTAFLHESTLWVGLFAGVGLVLWARTILNLNWVAAAYSAGMLVRGILHPGHLGAANAWKFSYAVPLTILVLGVVSQRRSPRATLVALLGLSGLCALVDARSMFGTLLLAAILVGWQLRPKSGSRPLAWGWTLLLLGGLAVAVYNLATALILDGVLGSEIQMRSQIQVQTAGSLILGGRPELAATYALIRHTPWGFGVGIAPSIYDVMAAKAGMIRVNYDPDNGYVDKYMFGGHVELHSAAGDMWAMFGLFGLAFVVLVTLLIVRGLATSMGQRSGDGLLTFLVCYTLWNLAFSPLQSAVPTLALTLGLVMPVAGRHQAGRHVSSERPSRTP